MSSRRLLPLSAFAIFLQAVSLARAASGLVSIEVGHVRRSAVMVEFSRLKKLPRPTIIVLHGGGGLARARRALGLDATAEGSGVAVVYPEALDNRWRYGSDKDRVDDAAFIKRLIAKLVADGASDRRRIYLAGVGSGGVLALRLGCEDADLFAGLAVVGAALPREAAASCKPARPLAILAMNGEADPKLPFLGGKADLTDFKQAVASAEQTLAPFAAAAGCAASSPTQTPLAHHDSKDPTRVVLERFNGCRVPVQLFRIVGGGPRRRAAARLSPGAQNHDLAAGRVIAAFFTRRAS